MSVMEERLRTIRPVVPKARLRRLRPGIRISIICRTIRRHGRVNRRRYPLERGRPRPPFSSTPDKFRGRRDTAASLAFADEDRAEYEDHEEGDGSNDSSDNASDAVP